MLLDPSAYPLLPGRPLKPESPLLRLFWPKVVLLIVMLCLAITAPQRMEAGTESGGEPRHYAAIDAPVVVLTDVTLIDGTGSSARHQQSVVIADGLISAGGDAADIAIPPGAEVMALPGRVVIPGIVGMHNHTHMPGLTFMPFGVTRLSLASGVTTIRTVGAAQPADEIRLARTIEAGETVGPRIYPSAPYLTGPDGNGPMEKPETELQARAFVREWAERGATWLKLYRHIKPDIAAVVIDEAHRQGLKVAGHLCSLTFRQAAELGIDSIEHGLLSAADFVADKPPGQCVSTRDSIEALDLDSSAVEELIQLLVDEDVTLTATPAIIESHFPHRPQADSRSLAALSPAWTERYHARQARLQEVRKTSRFQPALLEKLRTFERRFVAAGGRLVAGPDPGRHVLPGFGDQRNFELLVESGFTVPQAIQIMTANGAEVLGAGDRFGTVRAGLQADLVVIDGDLESDPSAIRQVEIVFKGGIGYDPAALLEGVAGQVGLR